jgi:hypothetical protein
MSGVQRGYVHSAVGTNRVARIRTHAGQRALLVRRRYVIMTSTSTSATSPVSPVPPDPHSVIIVIRNVQECQLLPTDKRIMVLYLGEQAAPSRQLNTSNCSQSPSTASGGYK